jgi:hypothetical protein
MYTPPKYEHIGYHFRPSPDPRSHPSSKSMKPPLPFSSESKTISEPVRLSQGQVPPPDNIEDNDEHEHDVSSSGHATEYHSFSDSDSDSDLDSDSEDDDDDDDDDDAAMTEEERKLERETRAAERQLVLEAAGIVVVAEPRPPPPLPPPRIRRPSTPTPTPMASSPERPKHRPAPAPPTLTPTLSYHDKPLPEIRTVDDAYERYEAFKQQASRTSVSSIEQLLQPPASPVSVASRESQQHERDRHVVPLASSTSYGSRISQLLARSRTPVQDRETRIVPTISAPILSASSSVASGTLGTPVREDGAAFGSVSESVSVCVLRGADARTFVVVGELGG